MTEPAAELIEASIMRAETRAAMARGRMVGTLLKLKDRVMPGALMRRMGHALADKSTHAARSGVGAVAARPAVATGLAALAALFLARKPLIRAISSDDEETAKTPVRSSPKSRRKAKP